MYVAMMEVRNSNELIIASFQLSIIVLNKTLIRWISKFGHVLLVHRLWLKWLFM
jgi:hypothetical protein